MIVVDSSVRIDFLNGRNAPHVRRLRAILGIDEVIVGDLMLCQVLQRLESEQAARDVEAIAASKSYRWLGMRLPSRARASHVD
jgi:predicted nucleic acid-binding protein